MVAGVFLAFAACASADKEQGPATPAAELSVGGARIRGGGIRMDVQVGRSLTRKPGKAGAVVVTPNAVVTP
ncbi:hypothetical protein BH11MYX3_BH11MYX3_38090 [soil metagenome]